MKRVVIIGSGFAGVWAAIGAARHRQELAKEKELELLVISQTEYHAIRVRNYENDLSSVRIPLSLILDPVGVSHIVDSVSKIDLKNQRVYLNHTKPIEYDRLMCCSGSQLYVPPIRGIDHSFNVDTYDAAEKLRNHLLCLPKYPGDEYTAVVIGGGFTGLEIAAELPNRLEMIAAAAGVKKNIRVLIIDHGGIGKTLGVAPQPTILKALDDLKIEVITNAHVSAIDQNSILLDSGKTISAQVVVCATGMRASPLASQFQVPLDSLGRMSVDSYLKIKGVSNCFAAGDVARAMVDDNHTSVMSCQHARPMGRIGGHNIVADLYDQPMIPYRQEMYVTILDLGAWGALYMEGWNRIVVVEGSAAKKIKFEINRHRIYPPLTGNSKDLMDAAAPIIQQVPARYSD